MQNPKDPYHNLSSEEIFQRVAVHLFAQGEPSRAKNTEGKTSNVCLYRGPNNTKCAVGFLIPNHLYKEEMEGNAIDALLQEFRDDLPSYFWQHKDLLSALQTIHDGYASYFGIPFNIYLLSHLAEYAGKHNYNAEFIRDCYNLSVTNPEGLKARL